MRSWFPKLLTSLAVLAVGTILVVRNFDSAHFIKAWWPQKQVGTFSTEVGEHRCEHFPEDSEVCLNTDSVIHYSFDDSSRSIELVSGEASFTVKKDTRPFNVVSCGILVHDLSTSFSVYKRQSSTLVTVIEGTVAITPKQHDWQSAPQYHELQQVEFDEATGTILEHPELTAKELASLLAWQKGRIDLTGRTLDEALAEFSRYHSNVRFRYPPAIGSLAVGGYIKSDNVDALLDVLAADFEIHSTEAEIGGQIDVSLSHETHKPMNPRQNRSNLQH